MRSRYESLSQGKGCPSLSQAGLYIERWFSLLAALPIEKLQEERSYGMHPSEGAGSLWELALGLPGQWAPQ